MRKVIKISAKVVSAIVLLLIFLPVCATLLLDIPSVQNYVVDRAMSFFSRKLETRVEIGRIDLDLFSRVCIRDFYVEDYQKDTLLYAAEVRGRFTGFNIRKTGLKISSAEAAGVRLYLRETPSGEMNIKQIVDRLARKDGKGNFRMYIDHIDIDDLTFGMERLVHRNPQSGVDFYDMLVDIRHACLKDFAVVRNKVWGDIVSLSAAEKSGFTVDDMNGYFFVDRGVIRLDRFSISTPQSSVFMPSMSIEGGDWACYKHFVKDVRMVGQLQNTTVSTDDIAAFAPAIGTWRQTLRDVDMSFDGTVGDFAGEIRSAVLADDTSIKGRFAVKGLPDIGRTSFKLTLSEVSSDGGDISALASAVAHARLPRNVESMLARAGRMRLRADFGGRLDSFRTSGRLATDRGNADFDVEMHPESGSTRSLRGRVRTADFDLGPVLGIRAMGRMAAEASLDGVVSEAGLTADAKASVERFTLNGYPYGGISAEARIDRGAIDGRAVSADSNMLFTLAAAIDLGRSVPTYDLEMKLDRADLHATGINRRDSVSVLSMRLDAHGSGIDIDDFDGRIVVSDVRYDYPEGEIIADRIVLDSRNDADSKYTKLSSPFVDATLVSKTSYRSIAQYLANSLHRYIPLLYDERSMRDEGGTGQQIVADDFSIVDINIKNINPIMSAVDRGWQIAEGSSVQLLFNPRSNSLTVQARADYIERDMMLATNLRLNANNRSDSLAMYLSAEDLYIGALHMPNLSVTGGAEANRVRLTAGFRDAAERVSGMIGMRADFARDGETGARMVHVGITPSHVSTRDKTWKIFSRGIDISQGRIVVDDFRVVDAGEQMIIDGVASREMTDSIELRLQNFDIAPFAKILERWGYRVVGRTSGHATVKSALKAAEITADIDVDSLSVNDLQAPPTRLSSKWDFQQNRARIIISDRERGDTLIRGYYQPSRGRYYARATIDSLPLSLISPFLSGVVSQTEGRANVDVGILGQRRQASLDGRIHVDTLSTKVDFTQTRYRLSDADLRVEKNHIYADRVPIFDEENNRGTFTMNLSLEHLSNITYDIRLDIDRMLVLDTDAADNDLFYGRVYASGDATMRGDKRGIKMDIEATTEDNSVFFMPLAGKSDISYADFVKFESASTPVDTTNYLIRRKMAFERRQRPASAGSVMDIDLVCNVRPNAEIQLIIDPTVGDIIKGRGEGQLNMRIVPKTNVFDMYGDYTINEGSYLFTLQNIWTKKFVIVPGSSIHWTGDPLGARLNIDAVYNLKASLQPLLGQGSGNNYMRAVPVECYIKLTDELMSPTVTFDINVPNVDPEIQSAVQSLLSSQQDIATQMFWLLMANTFSAEDTSGIGNSISATTGFELLSNQLSNWLSGDNYNIMFRYRPKSNTSSDEVDIGFSKSWIDNRLIVELEGNYLVDDAAKVSKNASNLMGEAYITWLIDKGGNFRFRGFTQTIDRYDENQGLQETGIGFYYSENFNTFRELGESIRNRFSSEKRKRRRAERRAERESVRQAAKAAVATEAVEAGQTDSLPHRSDLPGTVPAAGALRRGGNDVTRGR